MTRQMTGAKMVVQALKDQGVDTVFGYPGGAVLPIYDEIFLQNDIRHYLVRHEQGAGHMAEGYAHVSGKPGVAMVTSGPAATNLVTPLMDAYMDSVIDDRLYSKIDSTEFVEKAIGSRNVFQLAIGFEKDAILYFREFLPFLADADQKIVADLIEEEKGHIRRLADVQKQMDESLS